MASLFATQLSRHPAMQRVPMDTMYSRHPAQVDHDGRRFVPAVHRGPAGTSLFIYPFGRFGHRDRVLPDGRTIEYHPSASARAKGQLRDLLGQEVTLYAQVGRHDARQATVRVEQPPDVPEDVYLLRLLVPVTRAPVQQEPPKRVMWADMD